jgi:hypothetical protein
MLCAALQIRPKGTLNMSVFLANHWRRWLARSGKYKLRRYVHLYEDYEKEQRHYSPIGDTQRFPGIRAAFCRVR